MEKELKIYLLHLARATIAEALGIQQEVPAAPPNVAILKEKRGIFVTLEINHRLRGCIGNIEAIYSLEEGVRKNAIHAALDDPRFLPLSKEEFPNIEIEISILSVPQKLMYSSPEDLLEKLTPLKDGVIIRKGLYGATYLPQVWEQLKDKEAFLSSLCMKAGLSKDAWQDPKTEISTYQAEVFKTYL